MTDMEMNILSRLAMLKIANNVGKRFSEAENLLSGESLIIAEAIRNNDRENNPAAKSLLEWAESEQGIHHQ